MAEYSSFYLFMGGFITLTMGIAICFTWIYKKIVK